MEHSSIQRSLERLPIKYESFDLKLYEKNLELKIHKQAVIVSISSVIINFILAIISLTSAIIWNSAASSAFAADCALNVFSSIILLWRFSDKHADRKKIDNREQKACLALAVLFLLSGIAVIIKSFTDLIYETFSSTSIDAILYLASFGFIACGSLAIAKFIMYKRMGSSAMLIESINSLISVMFALVIITTTIIIQFESGLWRLDPIISILFAIMMIVYGIRVIFSKLCCYPYTMKKQSSFDNNSNTYIRIP